VSDLIVIVIRDAPPKHLESEHLKASKNKPGSSLRLSVLNLYSINLWQKWQTTRVTDKRTDRQTDQKCVAGAAWSCCQSWGENWSL